MKLLKQFTACLFLLLLSGVMLSACKNDDEGSGPNTNSSSGNQTTVEFMSISPVKDSADVEERGSFLVYFNIKNPTNDITALRVTANGNPVTVFSAIRQGDQNAESLETFNGILLTDTSVSHFLTVNIGTPCSG